MFQRLITGDPEVVCTIAAFAVAAAIFCAIAWRALRMKSAQSEQMATLPFHTPTPPSPDERTKHA